MSTINIADVDVTYRSVEVPDSCPMCGSILATGNLPSRPAVRELNLASANFLGTFGRRDGDGFEVDSEIGEERPSDAVWIPFAYECASCGEQLAAGSIGVTQREAP